MQNLKKILALSLVALSLNACNSGSSNSSTTPTSGWTYMGGTNQVNSFGAYGSPIEMPGGRDLAISWVDNSGNFWLFGGSGYGANGASGMLNDLWEYVPSTGIWIWVAGSTSTNSRGSYGAQGFGSILNLPGARIGAISWSDAEGNLWLFGGYGYSKDPIPGALNDLWKFTPSDHKWTWVSGSDSVGAVGVYGTKDIPGLNNTPGARLGAISWSESNGTQWLFGGSTTIPTITDYNDLWKFNPASNEWTWVSGESTTNASGIYGIQGQSSPNNQPGARLDSVSWNDGNGNLWVFGGNGKDGTGSPNGDLNDLWKYNIATHLWTWMSGSNATNHYGTYGQLGVASSNSIPGAREHRIPLSWADSSGNLWMFGGDGYANSTKGFLNDLWSYNPSNNQWTWVGGSDESNAFSNYGTQGVLTTSNQPGARRDAIGWVDSSGKIWIFGGDGNATNESGFLNDLWQYTY